MDIKLSFYSGFSQMIMQHDANETAKTLRELGITSGEPLGYSGAKYKQIFQSVEEAKDYASILGMEIPCFSVFADLYTDTTDKTLEDLLYNVRLAEAVGAKCFHHTIYPALSAKGTLPTYDEVIEKVGPSLIKVARYAEERGIVPVYEPQGLCFNGIEGVERLLTFVRKECKTAGVIFDFGNPFFALTQPYDFLKYFVSEVVHVHLKDYSVITEPPTEKSKLQNVYTLSNGSMIIDSALGEGNVRVADCIKLLYNHGYRGAYSSETMITDTYIGAYQQSCDYIDNLKI